MSNLLQKLGSRLNTFIFDLVQNINTLFNIIFDVSEYEVDDIILELSSVDMETLQKIDEIAGKYGLKVLLINHRDSSIPDTIHIHIGLGDVNEI